MRYILSGFIYALIVTTAWGQSEPITTLQGQSSASKFASPKLVVPYNQAIKTPIGGIIETGNKNMLVNGEFEGTATGTPTGWTCTTGTCTRTTTAGEFTSGLSAMKIVPASNQIDVSQTVTTTSGIQKQGFMRIAYKVPTTCSTSFVLRTLVDGSTQTEVPTSKLVFDNAYHEIEVPLVFGSTSAGVRVFANGTCTGNIFVDSAIVAQGLGLQNLQLDHTFTAKVSAAGTVTDENDTAWLTGNCALSGTNNSIFTCPYNTSMFVGATPNCGAFYGDVASYGINIGTNVTSTDIIVQVDASGTAANRPINIICQKAGNSYKASSASVYSQASADFGATPITITSNFTNSTTTAWVTRRGDRAYFEGIVLLSGTPGAADLTLTLPTGYVIDTNKVPNSANLRNTFGIAWIFDSSAGTTYYGQVRGIGSTSVQINRPVVSTSGQSAAVDNVNPTTFASSDSIMFKFDVPIVGWTNGSTIVGSFENVPTVPNAGARIDTFSVSYGATATTVCSTPSAVCAYNDNIGSSASVSKTATTGQYTLSAGKTYIKLKCTLSSFGASQATVGYSTSSGLSCSNCSTLSFGTVRTTTEGYVDSFGNLDCKGLY